jgi:hypothetical protein
MTNTIVHRFAVCLQRDELIWRAILDHKTGENPNKDTHTGLANEPIAGRHGKSLPAPPAIAICGQHYFPSRRLIFTDILLQGPFDPPQNDGAPFPIGHSP